MSSDLLLWAPTGKPDDRNMVLLSEEIEELIVRCGGVWRPTLFPWRRLPLYFGESKLGEYQGLLDILILWARDEKIPWRTHGGKIFGRQCGEECKLHHLRIQTLLCSLAGQS